MFASCLKTEPSQKPHSSMAIFLSEKMPTPVTSMREEGICIFILASIQTLTAALTCGSVQREWEKSSLHRLRSRAAR